MKHRNFGKALIAVLTAGLLGAVGCGDGSSGRNLHAVRGKVQYTDGSPVPLGAVVFVTSDGTLADGVLSADGTFELTTAGERGAPAGHYKVYLTDLAPSPDYQPTAEDILAAEKATMERPDQPPPAPGATPVPVAPRYKDPAASGLEADVPEADVELPVLMVERE